MTKRDLDQTQRDAAIETAVGETFVARDRRQRYRTKINSRGRQTYLDELFKQRWWSDALVVERVHGDAAAVRDLLRERGVPPTCYVMGDLAEDGKTLDLGEALERTEFASGALLVFDPHKLAYFSADWYGSYQYVLRR